MKQYRFEQIKPKVIHISTGFKEFLKENGIKPLKIFEGSTRYAYDSSDFTSWHLFFGEDKEKLKEARTILASFEYKDKPIFSVTGNGWGTGLSIMLNLSSNYD